MDEEEYDKKYFNLRILKSVQEYMKTEGASDTAVYPVRVPDDLLYQVAQKHGPEKADKLLHHIFRLGLSTWSEELFSEIFGSQENLEAFIQVVKKRTRRTE